MPHSPRTARLSATVLVVLALVTSGCADGATAPDTKVPQVVSGRALAGLQDDQGDDNDDQGGVGGKSGTIRIVLDLQPNAPTDVRFTTGGGSKFSNFTLDDDADAALLNSRTVKLKPGTYTVQGPLTAGAYSLTQISCGSVGGINNNSVNVVAGFVSISLEAGEQATCTFVMGVLTPI